MEKVLSEQRDLKDEKPSGWREEETPCAQSLREKQPGTSLCPDATVLGDGVRSEELERGSKKQKGLCIAR